MREKWPKQMPLMSHIVDHPQSLRWFCRIGIADEGFRKSALNRNIKVISDRTWEMINRDILGYAQQEGIEKGRKVRTDCTCVESNIHPPSDSTLLWDCARVLIRLILGLQQAGANLKLLLWPCFLFCRSRGAPKKRKKTGKYNAIG